MTIKQQGYFFELIKELGYDKEACLAKIKEKYPTKKFTELTTLEIAPFITILENEKRKAEKTSDKKVEINPEGDFPDDFRVWDRKESKMIYGIKALYKITWEPSTEPDRWHVMQWTGRKDDKGNKLYDFDIVKSYLGKLYMIQYSWTDLAWIAYEVDTKDKSLFLASFGKLQKVGDTYEGVQE